MINCNYIFKYYQKARKNVSSARLNYDACKKKLKNAKIEYVDNVRFKIQIYIYI